MICGRHAVIVHGMHPAMCLCMMPQLRGKSWAVLTARLQGLAALAVQVELTF